MNKKQWWSDATYEYDAANDVNGVTSITFSFPNAASVTSHGPIIFSTWLYEIKDGEVISTNLAAELLQCFIDRDTKERIAI